MKLFALFPAVALALLLTTGSSVAAANVSASHETPTRQDQNRVDVRKSNICFGGLDDGKLIPDDGRIDNPFRQTSELGCAVEGGQPTFMPDLAPLVPDGKLA